MSMYTTQSSKDCRTKRQEYRDSTTKINKVSYNHYKIYNHEYKHLTTVKPHKASNNTIINNFKNIKVISCIDMIILNKNYNNSYWQLVRKEERKKLLHWRMLSQLNQETVNGFRISGSSSFKDMRILLSHGCMFVRMEEKLQWLLLLKRYRF